MGSRLERHPHRKMLQVRADELEAQQKLGISIVENINEEIGQTGQFDMNALLTANRRLERAQVDAAWFKVLLETNLKAKDILKIWEEKDELSRTMDGNGC